jgi:hypothetical protein
MTTHAIAIGRTYTNGKERIIVVAIAPFGCVHVRRENGDEALMSWSSLKDWEPVETGPEFAAASGFTWYDEAPWGSE